MKKNISFGFSLIEIMMVLGLMGFIALGFMKFMGKQKKDQKTIMTKVEVNDLYFEIKSYLGKPGICEKNFGDIVFNVDDLIEVESIMKITGDDKYLVGKKYGGEKILIKDMVLKNFDPDNSEGTMGRGSLEISFDRGKNVYGGRVLKKIIQLDVERDTQGKIISCSVAGLQHQKMAQENVSGGDLSTLSGVMDMVKKMQENPDLKEMVKESEKGLSPEFKKAQEDLLKNIEEMNKRVKEMEESLNQ